MAYRVATLADHPPTGWLILMGSFVTALVRNLLYVYSYVILDDSEGIYVYLGQLLGGIQVPLRFHYLVHIEREAIWPLDDPGQDFGLVEMPDQREVNLYEKEDLVESLDLGPLDVYPGEDVGVLQLPANIRDVEQVRRSVRDVKAHAVGAGAVSGEFA